MSWFKLRPTFTVAIRQDRNTAIERLAQAAAQCGQAEAFRMHGEYGELHLPREEHRVWSPHLSFYVIDHESRQEIFGRFAPRVDVWTSVWIFYMLMAFTSFFGFTLAYSQWALNQSVWGFWIGAVPLVLILTLYLIAHIGQQLSVDQMHQLRDQFEQLLRDAQIDVSS